MKEILKLSLTGSVNEKWAALLKKRPNRDQK